MTLTEGRREKRNTQKKHVLQNIDTFHNCSDGEEEETIGRGKIRAFGARGGAPNGEPQRPAEAHAACHTALRAGRAQRQCDSPSSPGSKSQADANGAGVVMWASVYQGHPAVSLNTKPDQMEMADTSGSPLAPALAATNQHPA